MAIDPTDLETYYLGRVNETRSAAGLLPLTFHDDLMDAAADHNAWIDEEDAPGHEGVNGSSPQDRIRAAGYDAAEPWLASENVWYKAGLPGTGTDVPATRDTVEESLDWFLNSKIHRDNILKPQFQHMGISVMEGEYKGEDAVYVTQTFGAPSAAEIADTGGPIKQNVTSSDNVGLTRPGVFDISNTKFVDEELDYGDCLTCTDP
jgi:uncharacterized protein YkwD